MPERKIIWLLVLAAIGGSILSIVTAPNNSYSALVNSFSVGFVISVIFYFIVVYLPESQRKARIYRSMEWQYRIFKESCINIFLILSDSQEYEHRENLLNQEEFRRYFKNNNKCNENRWYAVANEIQGNEYYLNEIIYELRMLNDEIKFIRSSVDIHDEEAFLFLKRLSHMIHRMESTKPDYDDIKSFTGFLWSLFTGWSFIEGYRKADVVAEMLERIK